MGYTPAQLAALSNAALAESERLRKEKMNGNVPPAQPGDGKEWPGLPQTEEEFAKETIDYASMNESDCDPFDEFGAELADRIIEAKKQTTEPGEPATFPAELKAKTIWVRWRLEPDKSGNPTKVPYQLNGKKASHSNPATWGTYEAIVSGAVMNETQGIGICCDGSFVGFDLDGCRNPETGEIAEWAKRIINLLGTYTEITPSGYGVRVLTLGQLPDGARRFSLALSAGFGDKVGIEAYHETRYFTATGNRLGDHSGLQSPNVVEAHALCGAISREFPSEKRAQAAQFGGNDSGNSSVVFTRKPGSLASKLSVMMYGTITSNKPFVIANEYGDQVTAPSQSEADLSLATLLAMTHGDNPELIDQDFRESSLYRPKWDRLAESQIKKALATAEKIKEKESQKPMDLTGISSAQSKANAAEEASKGVTGKFPTADAEESDVIPAFDDSVITGIFRDIVDLAAGGTTIPRQFPFLVAKVYVGARMADGMTFEGVSDKSTMYGTAIGETGTSKDLSWKRTVEKILLSPSQGLLEQKVKVFNSADSGAGLRDAFFEPPKDSPIILRVSEVRSLGHKAGEKKNPEIVDTMIELANDHNISRVKAKRSKRDKPRSHDKAYLAGYMCGQNGEAYMSSFPGRKDMGLWGRFYPEYAEPVEAGDLPDIDTNAVLQLLARLEKFPFTGHMTMDAGAKDALNTFWSEQPKDVKTKVRFKRHLMLDMYFVAWSLGRMVATVEDLDVAIRAFRRQVVIRRVHFRDEVPDRVGHYIGLLKTLTESMRKRLNKGESLETVAMSIRDFQTDTNAYRDNEIATFNTAWRNFHTDHLGTYGFTARNGHKYTKYLPMPYEDEMWCATPAARAAFEAAQASTPVGATG